MNVPARILVTLALVATAACNGGNNPPPPASAGDLQVDTPAARVALRPIASCDELRDTFLDNWVEQMLVTYRPFGPIVTLPAVLEDTAVTNAPVAAVDNAAGAAPTRSPDIVGQTNLQVAGVDEADFIKADSDGNLYIAQHDKLVIADAFPPQPTMPTLATIELDGQVSGVYLYETESEKLAIAVVTPDYRNVAPAEDIAAVSTWFDWRSKTDLVIIDVSDPADPVVQRRLRLDGSLVSSRRVGSQIHLVQSFWLSAFNALSGDRLNTLFEDYRRAYNAEDDMRMQQLRDEVRGIMAGRLDFGEAQGLLPTWRSIENGVEQTPQTMSCESVYAPDVDLNHNQLLVVSSIDLGSDPVKRVAALGSGWIVHATAQDLFIVQPGSFWWWDRNQHQQSAIHHFAIGGDNPAYLSTGLVDGYVLNSFSLDYQSPQLRVATTQSLWNRSDRGDLFSTNHLFVLEDADQGAMQIKGEVRGYAENERIFSARFVGDRGYVVTFRQIDPLFSFDLSNPASPQLVGELKIPGFSNYMHPLGETHLLTIGQDGDDAGTNGNIAIKLFDVRDPANMQEVGKYTPSQTGGYSWSDANWDHHAFTWYEPAGMLAVPFSSSVFNGVNYEYRDSLLVLNVDINNDAEPVKPAGTVDHSDLLPARDCNPNAFGCDTFYHGWLARPTRSLFMTEADQHYLYSLSNIGVKAVKSDSLNVTEGSLLLPSPKGYYGIYF